MQDSPYQHLHFDSKKAKHSSLYSGLPHPDMIHLKHIQQVEENYKQQIEVLCLAVHVIEPTKHNSKSVTVIDWNTTTFYPMQSRTINRTKELCTAPKNLFLCEQDNYSLNHLDSRKKGLKIYKYNIQIFQFFSFFLFSKIFHT